MKYQVQHIEVLEDRNMANGDLTIPIPPPVQQPLPERSPITVITPLEQTYLVISEAIESATISFAWWLYKSAN